MKYFIIAGEASGDLHGSRLVQQLLKKDTHAEVFAWGGDLMQKAGARILKHYRELAFMGFAEVLMNIRTIYKNFAICKSQIISIKPDAIIYIDYPGFNLRMVDWAKKNGFKNYYYISPQLWAWKEGRVKHIHESVHKLYCILPFEQEFYKKHAVDTEYVGHPLLESVNEFIPDASFKSHFLHKKVLALLPGSRMQEIERMLPLYLKASTHFEEYIVVVAGAPSISKYVYDRIISKEKLNKMPLVFYNKTYDILASASLAWVSSGTATLETALFGVPQIVCYTGNPISYQIAKRLVKIKYISLVNLILDKPVLTELIQSEFTIGNLLLKTKNLDHKSIKKEYQNLHNILLPDNASERVALSIIQDLKQRI